MIGYVTLGTNDLPRAFYDALFAEIGIPRIIATEEHVQQAHRTALSLGAPRT